MDKVLTRMSIGDVRDMFRRNGFERTLKTVLRYLVFDRSENRQLRRVLSEMKGRSFDWPVQRITIGNASDPGEWPEGRFRFIYSEDDFEHVPRDELDRLCATMA
ncbi:MAG: hypothetical protein VX874_00285 [Pseudomonadota bacterium]|nr:hypothetical protein [Pseudomonadota bacterium]